MALNKAADAEHRLLVPGRVHKSAPPRYVGGDCGWAGRAGEPLLGARGYADLTTIFGSCRGANQQIVGAAAATPSDLAYHADVKRSVEQ
jgi:hypothetical protein